MEDSYSRKFTSKMTLLLTATIVVGITLGMHFSIVDKIKAQLPKYVPTEESTAEGEKINKAIVDVQNDREKIKKAFGNKYGVTEDDVIVTISKSNGSYAKGTVEFVGEVGGGWFLAAKVDNSWIIAADGNGVVMCKDIEPYNFPTNLVSECFDETTSSVVNR